MSMEYIRKYIERRDKILMSMNIKDMKELAEEYEISIPNNERDFIAAMHKVRIHLRNFPENLKEESSKWLKENGFTDQIIFDYENTEDTNR